MVDFTKVLNNPAFKRLGEAKQGFTSSEYLNVFGKYRLKCQVAKIKDGKTGLLECTVLTSERTSETQPGMEPYRVGSLVTIGEIINDNNGGDTRFRTALFTILGEAPKFFEEIEGERDGKTVLYTGAQAQAIWSAKLLNRESNPLVFAEFEVRAYGKAGKKYTKYAYTSVMTPELVGKIDAERKAAGMLSMQEALNAPLPQD